MTARKVTWSSGTSGDVPDIKKPRDRLPPERRLKGGYRTGSEVRVRREGGNDRERIKSCLLRKGVLIECHIGEREREN